MRYLTLCSKEAIDVRYFARKGALQRNASANDYPGLTFIEANEEDYAIIAESLGRFRLGVRGRLEDALLDPVHPSAAALLATFPHHVVNLDFCGEITPKHDHPYSATLQCIRRVIELQADTLPEWHLFLTFAVPRDNTSRDANPQLLANIEGNLVDDSLREAYGARPAPARLLGEDYAEFLRLGVMKFVAHQSSATGFGATLDGSYWYARQGGRYRIVKMVVRFRPLRRPHDLPSATTARRAYEEAVAQLFRTNATSVEASLTTETRRALNADLEPVLRELAESRVVTE
ncbi:MAG: hypothetical protein L0177_16825 [Chloroflexi bacterium]|nr:hypothetical protein [Chloroflexota bacterium]